MSDSNEDRDEQAANEFAEEVVDAINDPTRTISDCIIDAQYYLGSSAIQLNDRGIIPDDGTEWPTDGRATNT